jgi:hypothetical protein
MKRTYEKPAMSVVLLQHQAHLLQASGKFTNDAPTGGWDTGGACVKGQQPNDDVWDDDWSD